MQGLPCSLYITYKSNEYARRLCNIFVMHKWSHIQVTHLCLHLQQQSTRMCTNHTTLVASHEKDYKFHKLYAIDCMHFTVFKTIHYSARLQKHTLKWLRSLCSHNIPTVLRSWLDSDTIVSSPLYYLNKRIRMFYQVSKSCEGVYFEEIYFKVGTTKVLFYFCRQSRMFCFEYTFSLFKTICVP